MRRPAGSMTHDEGERTQAEVGRMCAFFVLAQKRESIPPPMQQKMRCPGQQHLQRTRLTVRSRALPISPFAQKASREPTEQAMTIGCIFFQTG